MNPSFDARFATAEVIRHLTGAHKGKHRLLENYRSLFAGLRVLDYGCGTGFFTKLYAKYAKEVVGYDTNPFALQLAQEMNSARNITYVSILPTEDFDLIIFNDSLEFMPNWKEVLASEVGKHILITAPAKTAVRSRFRSLFAKPSSPLIGAIEGSTPYKSLYQPDFDIPAFCHEHNIPFREVAFSLASGPKNHRLYIL